MKKEINITNIFTVPRCGTHFIWGEFIKSQQYQMIYDADRLPALNLLSKNYTKKLDFLLSDNKDYSLTAENPNYNFQYNSLVDWMGSSLTAKEHLEKMKEKYNTSNTDELFHRILELQDIKQDKELFSVNRFIYTMNYDFLFDGFEWSSEHALEACDSYLELLKPYTTRNILIIRKYPDWISSRLKMLGGDRLVKESKSLSMLTKRFFELGIPIYYMNEVIDVVKKGNVKFWNFIEPLTSDEVKIFCEQADKDVSRLAIKTKRNSLFRPRRFIQYLFERDDFRRLALVRSFGSLPFKFFHLIPVLGERFKRDINGSILNNAKIKL